MRGWPFWVPAVILQMAYDGSWLGGQTFISFDKKPVKLLSALGQSSHLLSWQTQKQA